MTSPHPASSGEPVDVLVVGSVNVDRTVHVRRHPRPGETLIAAGVEVAPGGKGANQAVGVARAGGRVRLVALVGDDDDGRAMCAHLDRQGVDVTGVRTVPEPTGTALITVDAAGENTIVVAAGANHSPRWEDLPAVVLEALACGCPVVATACSDAMTAVLEEAGHGAVVPIGDETAMADALSAILRDPPVRRVPPAASAYRVENGVAEHLDAIRLLLAAC